MLHLSGLYATKLQNQQSSYQALFTDSPGQAEKGAMPFHAISHSAGPWQAQESSDSLPRPRMSAALQNSWLG